ncbi:MAG: HlyD family efflux transporter periplasmic adaptor subunit [Clostridium sp.]|uniref:HlyD family secretion protein n=1 Tax=Clostridium sp. TaxID=1506 RepID=UPI0025B8CA65|nr:efflux RND transporter periplasmic adaptor subunit [Clostridium sp.]MCE5219750.1 HlyD family efflux transporter periplasmic adaptor subunit [Clostridium sp.]
MLKRKKFVKLTLSFLLIIATISGWFLIKFMQNNKVDDNIYYGTTEGDKINISTEIGGRIKEIKMNEGDKVKQGDLVATIYYNESSLNLENSEISIKNAENNLAKVQEGNRIEEIKAQEALVNQAQSLVKQGETALETTQNNVTTAQSNYDYKKKIYDDTVTLYESGAITKYNKDMAKNDLDNISSTLDNAKTSLKSVQAQVDNYKAQLDAATQKLTLLVNGATERDKNTAEYNLEQAKNNYEISKSQLDKSSVIAFTDGIIESVNFKPGEYLTPGSSVATLLDDENLWVKIYVPESILPKIKLDEEVVLKSDFLKDKTVNGKIIYISSEAEFTPMNIVTKKDRMKLVYEVKVKILDNLDVVKPGMLFSVNL